MLQQSPQIMTCRRGASIPRRRCKPSPYCSDPVLRALMWRLKAGMLKVTCHCMSFCLRPPHHVAYLVAQPILAACLACDRPPVHLDIRPWHAIANKGHHVHKRPCCLGTLAAQRSFATPMTLGHQSRAPATARTPASTSPPATPGIAALALSCSWGFKQVITSIPQG